MRNHAQAVVACDFFVSVTVSFRVLYVFVATEVDSRRIHLDDLSDPGMLYPPRLRATRLNHVDICVEQTLADPSVRRLLNHVKQLVASHGHIKVWAD